MTPSTFIALAAALVSAAPGVATSSTASVPTGELLIICSEDGAEVTIDGAVAGSTPLPVLTLASGPHRVEITQPGTEPFMTIIEVRPDRLNRLEVRLIPQAIWAPIAVGEPGIETGRQGHTPIITRWWFWGVVAAIGAVIVVTGVQLSGGDDFVPGGELGSTDTSTWDRF